VKPQKAPWSRQRRLAVAGALLVAALFIAANVHLVMVSFGSMPDCVAPAHQEQSAMLRVAKPAC